MARSEVHATCNSNVKLKMELLDLILPTSFCQHAFLMDHDGRIVIIINSLTLVMNILATSDYLTKTRSWDAHGMSYYSLLCTLTLLCM